MKTDLKQQRSPEQRAEEAAVRRQHQASPLQKPPIDALNQQSFAAILNLLARYKAARESQGLTLEVVAERMGIDITAVACLESGKTLNPTLVTLHKWAEAIGQKLEVELTIK